MQESPKTGLRAPRQRCRVQRLHSVCLLSGRVLEGGEARRLICTQKLRCTPRPLRVLRVPFACGPGVRDRPRQAPAHGRVELGFQFGTVVQFMPRIEKLFGAAGVGRKRRRNGVHLLCLTVADKLGCFTRRFSKVIFIVQRQIKGWDQLSGDHRRCSRNRSNKNHCQHRCRNQVHRNGHLHAGNKIKI